MGSSIKSSAYEYRIWMPDKLRMNPFYVERVHKSNGTKTLLTKTFASTGDAIQWIRKTPIKIDIYYMNVNEDVASPQHPIFFVTDRGDPL